MYSNLVIIGNMGQDPEVRVSKTGNSFTTFSVAVNKQGAGKDDKPLWVNVTAFGKTGEFVATYLKKGSMVFAEGTLEVTEFEGKDGKNHASTKLLANKVLSLSKREGDSNGNGNNAHVMGAPSKAAAVTEEMPF